MKYYSRKEDYVDVNLYEERLNLTQKIHLDLISVGVFSQYQRYLATTLQRLCVRYMNLNSRLGYHNLSHEAVVHYLTEIEKVPLSKLKSKNVKGVSVDKNKVLMPLLESGIAVDFLRLYIAYSEADTVSSKCAKIFERNIGNSTVEGWGGETLYEVPFRATPQLNVRFNYSSEDIIGFPSSIKHLVKAPKGYVLAWGDFAQSDARIAYNTLLKDEENIKMIKLFPDDIYAGFAKLVSDFTFKELQQKLEDAKRSFEFYKEMDPTLTESNDHTLCSLKKEIENYVPFTGFKSRDEREAYKVYCLRTIYGTRRSQVKAENAFISQFSKVLHSLKRYDQYWKDVSYRATLGQPLRVQCYMGHVELVPCFDGGRVSETLFKCLNYPIQGGSSEIVILTVNKILDTFYSLGCSEEDIRVYYVRHDEPIFIMKQHVMKDSWVFQDFAEINVDDWTPLKLSFEFGRTYSQKDEDLTHEFSLSCKINKSRLNFSVERTEVEDYYPLNKLMNIGVSSWDTSDGRCVICFYSEEHNAADFRIVNKGIDDFNTIHRLVEKYKVNVYNSGYRTLVVNNSYVTVDVMDVDHVNLITLYRKNSSSFTTRAQMLARTAVARLDNQLNDPIVEQNLEFCDSVGSLGVFKEVS